MDNYSSRLKILLIKHWIKFQILQIIQKQQYTITNLFYIVIYKTGKLL
jgi:hypothetical protein